MSREQSFIGNGRRPKAPHRQLGGFLLLYAAIVPLVCLGCQPASARRVSNPVSDGDRADAQNRMVSGSGSPGVIEFPFQDPERPIEERLRDLVSRLTLKEKIAQMMHDTPPIRRLGIPAYSWWNEALHGVARNGRATVFPQAIGLAATFDEALVFRVATAISDEARAKFNAARKLGNHARYSGLTFWSPNINIFRDPRWGRGQETYGEDPYLTSKMGVAFVRGLQGDDGKHLKTAACAKHFAVHSGPEATRHEFDARPSKQDLFETYLPAFEALVTGARVEGVMSAYNRVYGEPASANRFLLQDLLRKRWGFQGYVVSDCWALEDVHKHHGTTNSRPESAALALKTGVNVDCGVTYSALDEAIHQSLITEAEVDRSLVELLRTRFRLGLFDPSTNFDGLSDAVVASEEHAELARAAAQASFVLLKNRGSVLPLSKRIRRLALIGPYVADGYVLLGNYHGAPARMTTLLEGITERVNAGASVRFKHGFLEDRPNVNPMDWTTRGAHESDAIIVTLGLSGLIEGEEGAALLSPHKGDRDDAALPPHQLEFLKKLRAAGNKPIVVVLFAGSPLAVPEVHAIADAVLFAWYPGQAGGQALADVLFGDVAPSGRLPITFPKSTSQLPPFDDYSMENRGYRFMQSEPLYPFGFGLSYGKVSYEGLQLSATQLAKAGPISAHVTVTNLGQRELEEVVQLYLTDEQASTRVPKAKLVAFERVTLGPGQRSTVKLEVPTLALSLVDENGNRAVEPGSFRLTAGGASPGPRAQQLGSPTPVSARFLVKAP